MNLQPLDGKRQLKLSIYSVDILTATHAFLDVIFSHERQALGRCLNLIQGF